jgi:Tfp pilus assembly PilM family ATPase
MNPIKNFFQKILASLHVRSLVGGLEISDQVLRLVYYNGKTWQMAAVRLVPGVIEKGKIKDAQALVDALTELKSKVPFGKKKNKKMNVVVSLSSVNMYSQVFALPAMEGKDLAAAVDLNVRMVSPVDVTQTYFGWELLGSDEGSLKSEISAAFVDKALVDELTQTLYIAGFITVGVESRALALVRIFRQKGTGADVNKSYLLLDIDNSGIDFLIIRKGKLYFEYASRWTDLADDKGQIYITKFKEALEADMRQVMNFYTQHWPEPLAAIILAATAFEKEAEEAVQKSSSLPVIRMTLVMDQQVSLEWLVALGCSLRGMNGTLRDKEINLSGEGAIDTFHREQLLNFLVLWRVVIPVVLGCLIIMVALADNFLSVTRSGIETQPTFNQQELTEMAALEASSTAFNRSVTLVANAESQINKNYLAIADIENAAAANSVMINHISFQGTMIPIVVAGSAQSEAQIVAFKSAVQSDPHFGPVDLPLTNIQANSGEYTFSMTLPLSSNF